MRIEETRYPDGHGFGGVGRKETRVTDLPDTEPMPPNAVRVPDDTKKHDWEEVKQ